MRFVELSIADLRDRSHELAKLVSRDGFRPEAVAYLARGAYLIGVEMGAYFGCPLIELSAHRSGEAVKGGLAPILARLPKFARRLLRSFEIRRRLTSGAGDAQRKTMRLTDRFPSPAECKRILLVDDSVDTGSSVRAAVRLLRGLYPGVEIGVAVLNTFEHEPLGGCGEWHLYEGLLLSTPSSKDNAQYGEFLRMYEASAGGVHAPAVRSIPDEDSESSNPCGPLEASTGAVYSAPSSEIGRKGCNIDEPIHL